MKLKRFWKKHKVEICVIGGTLVVGGLMLYKLNKIATTVGVSMKDLSSRVNIDIEKNVTDAAIQKVVDQKANEVVSQVSRSVIKNVTDDMHYKVKKAVDLSYSDVKESVSSEISKQVSRIDMRELKKEVTYYKNCS